MHRLTINTDKTEYLALNSNFNGTVNLAGTPAHPQPSIKYLGFKKHRKNPREHHDCRLDSAKKALRGVLNTFRRLPHLQVKHKITITKACIEAAYLYGIEITSGGT